jgi:23S rRNA pseudouridine2605 synthase
MRINKFIAQATGLSRRAADKAIEKGRVRVNQQSVTTGRDVSASDVITLDDQLLKLSPETTTVLLHKPVGYVCSRAGQGHRTVYDLLPPELHHLKPVGRLDKDSSGLLLLTNKGGLANRLTHPRYAKEKVYIVELNKLLIARDKNRIEQGVKLEDGHSKLQIKNIHGRSFTVTMSEGRNRQIRRTFAALGYNVIKLQRTKFGPFELGDLRPGKAIEHPY